MRATLVLATVAVIGRVVVVCDGSSTSPFRCDDDITIASFEDVASVTGIVTSIEFVRGASAQITQVRVPGDPDFTMTFTVSSATAVFERAGSAPPIAASACFLAVGQQVQFPHSMIGSGFGDSVPVVQGGESPPLPPTIGQIVIVR
jgi:hypothetical protein